MLNINNIIKKAVILAAGEGRRMHPFTLITPKPLLKIKGRALIEYIFDAIPPEVEEVIVVVKYLKEQIKDFLGKEFRHKRILFAEGSEKGTAYSFLAAQPFVSKGRFLFFYGDEFPNPKDVKAILKKELGAVVFESSNPNIHGIVKLRPDGSIKEIVEKPKDPESNLAVDGIMLLNADIFNYKPKINPDGEYYFSSLLNQFVKNHKVWPIKTEGFIGDITTPKDIKRVENLLKQL